MAEIAKHFLSKSTYVRGLQCNKSLFLYKKSPELRDEIDPAQQAIFSSGTDVGILARDLFPGGKDASSKNGIPGQESIKLTQQLIDSGTIRNSGDTILNFRNFHFSFMVPSGRASAGIACSW